MVPASHGPRIPRRPPAVTHWVAATALQGYRPAAFEMAIQLGGARSVMPSYADVDGVPATADAGLLTKLLREVTLTGLQRVAGPDRVLDTPVLVSAVAGWQPAGKPRRGGTGGTVFPASARPTGMTTESPDAVRTVNVSPSAASSTPSTSAISSPPPADGRRQRTTTRRPTSAGPSRTSSR